MAKLGAAQTDKFFIGTAELRLGLMSKANLLTQAESIGLIDDASYSVNQTSVDLLGGFPRTINATAITEQTATISATLREYSRRNLRIMLGDGLAGVAPTAVVSAVDPAADVAAGSTTIDVTPGDGGNFAVDDVVIIYPTGRPQDVSVLQIASIAVDELTFKTGQTTVADYDALTESPLVFQVYVAHQIPIGAVTQTNYFSAMLIQQENSTGNPVVVSFWKAAIGGSLEVATNAEDFSSSTMELKLVDPSAAEYGAGQDFEHVADLIPLHPTGMFLNGAV